jgi:hypothetical protein
MDPLAKKFPSESNYMFGGGSPILMVDDKGEKKTVYTIIEDQKTGKTYIKAEVSSGLLKRISTHVETGIFADRSDFYRQNDWYDYTVTNRLVIGKDGKSTFSSYTEVTKLRTSTYPFMGEQYAMLKVGESWPKVKEKGMFDGFYLYSKDADGSDSKFNPTGGAGSKAVDAGVILQAFGRINTIVGTPPDGLLEVIKYAHDGSQITFQNAGDGIIEVKNKGTGFCKNCGQPYIDGNRVTDPNKVKELREKNGSDSIQANDHK